MNPEELRRWAIEIASRCNTVDVVGLAQQIVDFVAQPSSQQQGRETRQNAAASYHAKNLVRGARLNDAQRALIRELYPTEKRMSLIAAEVNQVGPVVGLTNIRNFAYGAGLRRPASASPVGIIAARAARAAKRANGVAA